MIENLKEHLTLYAITDSTWLNGRTLAEVTKESIEGGATIVQYRAKNAVKEDSLSEAKELCALCHSYGVPFIINDDANLAVSCGADGVHVGQDDMDPKEARKIIGSDMILGVSAHDVEEAEKAEQAGADYLGCGAIFGSSTKTNVHAMTPEILKNIAESVKIPIVAIGGITEENLPELKGLGLAGAAVISAIFAADDVKAAAQRLRSIAETL